jgi:hypothetical protein
LRAERERKDLASAAAANRVFATKRQPWKIIYVEAEEGTGQLGYSDFDRAALLFTTSGTVGPLALGRGPYCRS